MRGEKNEPLLEKTICMSVNDIKYAKDCRRAQKEYKLKSHKPRVSLNRARFSTEAHFFSTMLK